MRYVKAARVVRPFGRSGCVRVELFTATTDWLKPGTVFFLAPPLPEIQFLTLKEAFRHRERLIFCFTEINSLAAAEKLKGRYLQCPVDVLPPEQTPTSSLVDYQVVTTKRKEIGKVKEVLETPAHPVLVLEGRKGEILLPLVKEFVKIIDKEKREIILTDDGYQQLT